MPSSPTPPPSPQPALIRCVIVNWHDQQHQQLIRQILRPQLLGQLNKRGLGLTPDHKKKKKKSPLPGSVSSVPSSQSLQACLISFHFVCCGCFACLMPVLIAGATQPHPQPHPHPRFPVPSSQLNSTQHNSGALPAGLLRRR